MTRRSRNTTFTVLATITLATLTIASHAQNKNEGKKIQPIAIADVKLDHDVDFERDVLPIFRRNCLACHNSTEAESDLILETPQSILKGGGEGPAVVPKDSTKSLLLRMAAHQVDTVMPPADNEVGAKPLTPQELGILKLWIDSGATGQVTGSGGPIGWQPLPPGINPIYAVAVSPDGQFAVCGRANQIFVHHVTTGQLLGRLTDPALIKSGIYDKPGVAHLDLVQSLAFSPDGERFASGGFRTVKIWRRAANPRRSELAATGDAKCLAVSRDGTLAATGEPSGAIKLWDLATGQTTKTLSGHAAAVGGLCFSADAKRLVSGSADKTFRLWDTAEGKELGKTAAPAEVTAVALVMGGQQVATGGADNVIRTWALPGAAEENKPVKEMAGHGGPITCLSVIDAEGKNLLSGSQDGTLRHWNAEAGSQVRQMNHGAPVSSVAASADGQRFASAGGNNVAKLWDATNGQEKAQMKGDYRTYARVDKLGREINLVKGRVTDNQNDLKQAQERKQKEEENQKKATDNLAATEKTFKEKEAAAKKPTADKEAADKELAAATPLVKQTADAKTAADTIFKQADEDLKKANEAKQAADKVATDATNAFNTANTAKTAKEQAAKQAADKLKQAQDAAAKAKEALDKDKENKGLADANTAAQKALADATAAKKTADDELAAAVKAFTAAETAKKDADAKQALAAKAATDANEKRTKAQNDLNAANKAAQDADNNLKTAENKVRQAKGPYDKAVGEMTSAKNAHEAAMRSVEAAKKSVETATAVVPVVEVDIKKAQDAQKQLETDLETAKKATTESEKNFHGVAFDADGWQLAVAGEDGLVHLYNTADGGALDVFQGHAGPVQHLAAGAGGAIVSLAADKKAIVWNAAAGWTLERTIGGPDKATDLIDRVIALDFSSDGKLLATGSGEPSRSGEIKVWNVADGKLLVDVKDCHSDTVFDLEFSPDDVFIASAAADRFVKVHEVPSGKFVRAFEGHTHHVLGVGWQRNGKMIASGGADQVVKLWDFKTGDQKRTNIQNLGKEVTSVNFMGDGEEFIISGGNSMVRSYRSSNGGQVRSFSGPQDFVYNTAASDDGKVVAAGGQDSILRVWNATNGQLLKQFDPPPPPKDPTAEKTAAK